MLNLQENARRIRLGALTILTLACLISLPAQAAVEYLARSSSISTVVCGATCSTEQVTDTTLDTFSQSLGTLNSTGYASQQSQLSQGGISVSLQAMQSPDSYSETANADFSVTFDVTTLTSFQLSGNGSYLLGSANSAIAFSGPACSMFAFPPCSGSQQNGNWIDYSLSQSGTLQPGQYTLTVDAEANGQPYLNSPPSAGATAQLSLTPVPLPASGVLLATGLLFLMLLRFRENYSGR